MALAALAIKLGSRGPVFYLSERVGLDGQSFRMVKFRTMVVDADKRMAELAHLNESEGGMLFKMRDDPRITRIGKLLRRYSIDELPQFFNVLDGAMSIVGPRRRCPARPTSTTCAPAGGCLVHPGHHRAVADQRALGSVVGGQRFGWICPTSKTGRWSAIS